MAKTLEEIKQEMLTAKANEPALNPLNSTSITAIWRLWIYVIAVGIWTLEKLFDTHKADVEELISRLKPHTLRWYRDKALIFRSGKTLIVDSDKYDDTGLTASEIVDLQVVKQAAAVEQVDNSDNLIVRVKIAGGDVVYNALEEDVRVSVEGYFRQIKDAGVRLQVTTGDPDELKGNIKIWYNPTVLNSEGKMLLGGTEPARVAINKYLQNLTFNGEFSIQRFVDAVQVADGVELVHVVNLTGVYKQGMSNIQTNIEGRYTPDSGYMRVFNSLNIVYEAYL